MTFKVNCNPFTLIQVYLEKLGRTHEKVVSNELPLQVKYRKTISTPAQYYDVFGSGNVCRSNRKESLYCSMVFKSGIQTVSSVVA